MKFPYFTIQFGDGPVLNGYGCCFIILLVFIGVILSLRRLWRCLEREDA